MLDRRGRLFASTALIALSLALTGRPAWAAPPVPANDAPAGAIALGPAVPVVEFGTLEGAVNDISGTGLPGIGAGNDDGPDVFYQFTPAADGTYRIQIIPWQRAPLRASGSERRFVIYAGTDFAGVPAFLDGIRASTGSVIAHIDVMLTMGTTYDIGVDHDATTRDNCSFTLVIDTIPGTTPEDCASAEVIPTTLPYAALNNITGAAADFAYTDDAGRCDVQTATIASGIDHVYQFTPAAGGDYAFELIGAGFDSVIYIDDECPPDTSNGCLGAFHNNLSGGGKHNLIVATLSAGVDYWIVVDEDDGASVTGNYVLMVDTAFGYEISEIEPSETPASASPVTTPLNGGQLVGPADVDWFSITGVAGDRIYAWANNGGTSNTTIDLAMGFYATDGTTLIEFDDEDCDGATADDAYEDLTFIYSTSSPVIAGAALTGTGDHYLNVLHESVSAQVVHRYLLHVGVEPTGRAPLAECEPNDTITAADRTGKHFYSGVIPVTSDSDFYAFDAVAGDRVFIALDGDPERDADGLINAASDPKAFAALLLVYDPAGDVLFSDISDANTAQTGLPVPNTPDYPAQGGFFVARATGTHYVEVTAQSSGSSVSDESTYELAIFLDDAAPAPAEDVDPVIGLVPDFTNNTIAGTATDNAGGDSGVCSVTLFADTNLQITNLSGLPAGMATFDIELGSGAMNGAGKLLVTDCEGNTACESVTIDVTLPVCGGGNTSNRSPMSLHDPIHVPDNNLTGIDGTIDVADAGLVTKVEVTIDAIDSLDTNDLDIFLVSPMGTSIELVTDRMSSLGDDMVDVTFSDDATELIPILSSAAPYTGTWLPEDPAGMAEVNGEQAQGTWRLNVIDDASAEDFGATLVKWSLNLDATFAGPERFDGTASDDEGIASIALSGAVNAQLSFPNGFTPGDLAATYVVTLVDPGMNGSGTVTVTDLQDNTCQSVIALDGLPDVTAPSNSGSATTDLTFGEEVQQVVVENDPAGVVSTINIPDSFLVGEVEVALAVDSENQGRMAAKLSHGGEFASLVNRIGQDEHMAAGNTKNSFDVILDDDAPVADDIHLEPALGTIATLGLHQPDGRGEFFGDGITIDDRDNMLFKLGGLSSMGDWEMLVADTRAIGTSDNVFRRWSMTLKNPCGPERFVGRAIDLAPGSGICSIDLAPGAVNLMVVASFTPGDEIVDYRVELIDPTMPGSGDLEIEDCALNIEIVSLSLVSSSGDSNLPLVSGSVNSVTDEFEGTATDNQAGDTGVDSIDLAPWFDNLQIASVDSLPAASANFTVGLVNPLANGRGYVRVTDGCGLRSYVLVAIDATDPVCTSTLARKNRYFSGTVATPIPDNNVTGVSSSIVVADAGVISDVDVTFNITHAFDDDIDLTLTSPAGVTLFLDVGSTGNDFIDTTIDDEAAMPIPDSAAAAPFTGSFQPLGGPALLALDGGPTNATYTLRAVDDKVNDLGQFESWSVLVGSATFPEAIDGRAADSLAHDFGIASIVLLPGAENLTLTIDPAFTAGDAIARYLVSPTDPASCGSGVVRVTDGAGNICDEPVEIGDRGDVNMDTMVDLDDVGPMVAALLGAGGCQADVNKDGEVNGLDIALFVECVLNGMCP